MSDDRAWHSGGIVAGGSARIELHSDECVLVIREGVGVMCVRADHQHDPNPILDDLARRRWWHRITRRNR